jgi:hypothetical protein
MSPSSCSAWLRAFGGETTASASRCCVTAWVRWLIRVVHPEVVRLVELKRGEPEQFRGLGFVTTEATRIAPVRVADYLAALPDQSSRFGEIDRIGLMGICVSRDGKQCETEDV